ncbi:MAG: 1-phosphofructokinase family hexose kinase [Proteobacteria bacterium]|nr:1-phosphofructokinase family hexose kinase [Pseudomonadota bacterium]
MTILTITLHPAIDRVVQTQRVIPNEISRIRVTKLYGGGKGINVARALTRLDVPVIASGFQGGHSGDFIIQELEKEGIRTDFVLCNEPTRTSTLLLEDETGDSFALYEPGQAVSQKEIDQLLQKIDAHLEEVSLVLLCGSGQTELLESTFSEIILLAKRHGKPSIIDSSGKSLDGGIDSKPDMVKINQIELSEYFKQPLNTLEEQVAAILYLQAQGISIIALSRGSEGMIATNGMETYEAKIQVNSIVNVVGAGDSLLAGVSKTLLEGGDLKEMVRWGVACGTANTQVRGAGFITKDLVERMLAQVSIWEIKT